MPHKKNPDVFEIIRGRCNQVKARGNEIRMITGNLPSGYHRDLQLIKEALFESIQWIKECLFMTTFMMKKVEVKKDILEDEIYDYLFTVEKVNELVQRGTSFRDAYREVAAMIEKGEFKPDKQLRHMHEGSIGNLCNEQIRKLMEGHQEYFESRFSRIDECIKDLIENK